jgi:hypothetical protein
LIPTSQQFDTEWVFFFFFFWGFPPFAIEVATQVKSSMVFSFFSQQILRVQQIQKAKRSREQARTRKEQTKGDQNPSGKTKKHGK